MGGTKPICCPWTISPLDGVPRSFVCHTERRWLIFLCVSFTLPTPKTRTRGRKVQNTVPCVAREVEQCFPASPPSGSALLRAGRAGRRGRRRTCGPEGAEARGRGVRGPRSARSPRAPGTASQRAAVVCGNQALSSRG